MNGALTRHAEITRQAGRAGDTELVHLTPAELQALHAAWGQPTINPATGLPEYGFFSRIGKFFKKAAPFISAVLPFAFPGIGTAIGGALGATGPLASIIGGGLVGGGLGALSGGGLKNSLLGGGLGALSAGLAPMVKNALVGTEVGNQFGLTPGQTIFDTIGGSEIPLAMNVSSPRFAGEMMGAPASVSGSLPRFAGEMMDVPAPALGALASGASTPAATATTTEPSFFAKNKMPLALGAGALLLGGMGREQPQAARPGPSPGFNAPLPAVSFDRNLVAPETAAPYYTFGTLPFAFYEDNFIRTEEEEEDEQRRREEENFAGGGYAQGPGSGRDDTIPARLSDNEYVMDAETVALLGDGSAGEGARRLDKLRQRLRRHKGSAMVKGRFSPAARSPERYLEGEA